MKQIILLFALLVGVMAGTFWLSNREDLEKLLPNNASTPESTQSNQVLKKGFVTIGSAKIEVEIVRTKQDRSTGLSKYDELVKDTGMLFVFEREDTRPPFWMKDMKFPIDIIWINDDKVVQVTANIPTLVTNTSENRIPKYLPNQPVDYVLEVSSGFAKQEGIKAGDTVNLPNLDGVSQI